MESYKNQPPTLAKPQNFIQILLAQRLISKEQLSIAQKEQQKDEGTLEACLLKLGFISDQALTRFIAKYSGHKKIALHKVSLDPKLIAQIPQEIANQHKVIPVAMTGCKLSLAMADVYNIIGVDAVRSYFPEGTSVSPMVASQQEILEAIDTYYNTDLTLEKVFQEIEQHPESLSSQDASFKNPITRLVNVILSEAIHARASDIHFQPFESFVRLQFRIDGVLEQKTVFHTQYWSKICTRIKVISKMNIAESRRPQNGRFSWAIGIREVDFRVSAHPTLYGENVVLRILDQSNSLLPLTKLGFGPRHIKLLKRLAEQPQGLLILTGPTGTGKTTTLYSILQYLNSGQRNIMTLEDPIEYHIPMIRQSAINELAGTTFAQGVRSLLRQDPDVILIGEVRDEDTASMALRAVMTGHQVLTTLHTQDTFGVIPRLIDLGVSPQHLAGHLTGVVSQRLIRLLCADCKQKRLPTSKEQKVLQIHPSHSLCVARGCPQCRHTGFKGRSAITEVLQFTDELNDLLAQDSPLRMMRKVAHKNGFRSLQQQGFKKVTQGLTTLEEIIRITGVCERTGDLDAQI